MPKSAIVRTQIIFLYEHIHGKRNLKCNGPVAKGSCISFNAQINAKENLKWNTLCIKMQTLIFNIALRRDYSQHYKIISTRILYNI